MASSCSPREPSCAICGAPIRYGDLTIFLHGDLAHQDCYAPPADVTELVAEFLCKAASKSYCNGCLSALLKVVHHQVNEAATRLRADEHYSIIVGAKCDGCGQLRITIGAKSERMGPARL